ncbi:DNA-processing protein DprA [Saprospiraceae bacterium]|nr:DNA-processing protein DprA [Saprospiraceae bacterium]
MNNDLLYKIAITKIPKVGAITAKNLVSYCGGPKAVFEASQKELISIPGIGRTLAENIRHYNVLEEAEKEIEFIENNNIQCLFYTDEKYPHRLKYFNDSPVILYFKGKTDLNHDRIVSIIGTRTPTPQGKIICEEIIAELQKYNVLVISGLAYGIDVTAHRKSISLNIPTVGVLGHGLSMIYPHEHKGVSENMIKNGGVLTEFTYQQGPEREHFPMRNRIVAGMCDALIVVETKERGGSMITAELANGYNKNVFAVPGRARDKKFGGGNLLIKDHKAQLVECADDVIGIMGWKLFEENRNIQKQLFVELSEREQVVIEILKTENEVAIDKLSYVSKLQPSEVSSLLLELEFKGMIKTLPGKRYMLV